MTLESLISTYGYAAVAVGTFLEGETILVMAGFAAHLGYLHLPWVIFWAFCGTLFGDQLYFHIGRRRGIGLLDKHPHWKARSKRVFKIIHRHQLPVVLGFRFLYGMRTLTPFLLGASGFSPKRFFILNFFGGLCWSAAIGVIGYMFGHAAKVLIGKIEHYEGYFFIVLAILGAVIWFILWLKRRREEKEEDEP